MNIQITSLLRRLCLDNNIDIEPIIRNVNTLLLRQGLNVQNISLDLGLPSNSHSYRFNSEFFNILIDPLAIINAKNSKRFLESLFYEIGHEICHATITKKLSIFESVTLEIKWFLDNGLPLDDAIRQLIRNCLENIKIDTLLTQETIFMNGFYTRQYAEYCNTKEYLKTNPIMLDDFIWLGEFLSVVRRALVSKVFSNKKLCVSNNRTIDMNFRSQVGCFLSNFRDQRLNHAWLMFKTQTETGYDIVTTGHEWTHAQAVIGPT